MTLPMKPILLAVTLILVPALLPIRALADTAPDLTPETVANTALIQADDVAAPEAAPDVDEVITPQGLRILDAAGIDPDDFLWEWRILAVMADTPSDPAFIRQMREIDARAADLFERDLVVLIDTDRASGSALRQRLRPRGFMLAIIDKDGEVKQRRPAPRDVRELNAVIDRFPLRRQEMMERRPAGR